MNSNYSKQLLIFGFLREYCQSQSISLPPADIIKLFELWTAFNDYIDVDISDDKIDIKTLRNRENIEYQTVNRIKGNDYQRYKTAVGTYIIRKGIKHVWNFQILQRSRPEATILIGVIDDEECIKTNRSHKCIADFCKGNGNGFGISFYSGNKFNHNGIPQTFPYLQTFDLKQIKTFSMTLDLTTKDSYYGILSYDIDAIPNNNQNYTHVAFDRIDASKSYRCAIGLWLDKKDVVAILPPFIKCNLT